MSILRKPESTCWTVIRNAAAGNPADRDELGRRYLGVVRAYLASRWRGLELRADLDDAVQDVFVECFRDGGLLERARSECPGGFRAFLFGAVRNVALRAEERRGRRLTREADDGGNVEAIASREESLSRIFDRAWAKAVVREAAERQAAIAATRDAASVRRVELLRLRFHEGMPIRAIASLWHTDPAPLHHEYARARQEFLAALRDVLAAHHPGTAGDIDRECAQLLALLE